jgi:DNA-binding MarR family transcriptional regulator
MSTRDYSKGALLRAVIDCVAAHPGRTSVDIAAYLGHPQSSISPALTRLYDDGKVTRQRDGRCFRYMVVEVRPTSDLFTEGEARNLAVELSAAEQTIRDLESKIHAAEDREAALLADLAHAKAEANEECGTLTYRVMELTEWRDAAIEKYPDLEPTDPLLLRARQIAEEAVRGRASRAKIESIRSGRYDSLPVVQAALAALRSVQA